MAPRNACLVALLAVCVLPDICTSFGVMPGALTLRRLPASGMCRSPVRGARLRMSSEEDGGQAAASSAKESLLKKLAATDTPKGPPPKEVKKSVLPEVPLPVSLCTR
eukprot:34532-Rhodomonas_salina.1